MMLALHHLRAAAIAALLGISLALTAVAFAQGAPGIHEDNSGLNGALTHEDIQKLGGEKSDAGPSQTREAVQARAKAKAESEELLAALQLSCQVSDAQVVAAGTSKPTSAARRSTRASMRWHAAAAWGTCSRGRAAPSPWPFPASRRRRRGPPMWRRENRPVSSASFPGMRMSTPWWHR